MTMVVRPRDAFADLPLLWKPLRFHRPGKNLISSLHASVCAQRIIKHRKAAWQPKYMLPIHDLPASANIMGKLFSGPLSTKSVLEPSRPCCTCTTGLAADATTTPAGCVGWLASPPNAALGATNVCVVTPLGAICSCRRRNCCCVCDECCAGRCWLVAAALCCCGPGLRPCGILNIRSM